MHGQDFTCASFSGRKYQVSGTHKAGCPQVGEKDKRTVSYVTSSAYNVVQMESAAFRAQFEVNSEA